MNDYFDPADVAGNFNIAATRIHIERFIGKVKDWAVLIPSVFYIALTF